MNTGFVLLLFAGIIASSALAAPAPMIDAHSHYTAADAAALAPADVVARLDAAGIARVVVSGTPADEALRLAEAAPERVIPLLGVYASHRDKAGWMHDAELPARVEAALSRGGWAGLGELHLFAADAGNPVFAALVGLAARHDVMLLLHGDPEIVDRAFALAPELRVLWAHLGTEPDPVVVGRVLARHAERALWVDTSVRDARIAPQGVLDDAWRELFEAHPTRFVVAVDTFSTQRWRRYGEVVEGIRAWVGQLDAGVQERLLRRNAEALFAPWLRDRP